MSVGVDFHTHILPAIDDGSQDETETVAMLNMMKSQDIGSVVASPHFYPGHNFETFLEKRKHSIKNLMSVYDTEKHPKIFIGAEVAFFRGISKSQNIKKMCIIGTKYLLLEMPFEHWSDEIVQEVCALKENDITPIVVHIERYMKYQRKRQISYMLDIGVLFQSNAEFFCNKKTQRKALYMLKTGEIHLLGSDCHNKKDRLPNLKSAINIIYDYLGNYYVEKIQELSNEVLNRAIPMDCMVALQ